MPHIHWVTRQLKLEIPRDKDEVNEREIHECDGRTHDPDTMVDPLSHWHPIRHSKPKTSSGCRRPLPYVLKKTLIWGSGHRHGTVAPEAKETHIQQSFSWFCFSRFRISRKPIVLNSTHTHVLCFSSSFFFLVLTNIGNRFPRNPLLARRVDPSAFTFSLSLQQHSYIIFSSQRGHAPFPPRCFLHPVQI
jgi:hypothetical protein